MRKKTGLWVLAVAATCVIASDAHSTGLAGRGDERHELRVVIEGAAAVVPQDPLGNTGRFARVWAFLPQAWNDSIGRRVSPAELQSEHGPLPYHHPVLQIPARNLWGEGHSDETVLLYLNAENPREAPRDQDKAQYEIVIEPFAGRDERVAGYVHFEGLDRLPVVYQHPPEGGAPGRPAALDLRAIEASPEDLPVAARIVFEDGEALVAESQSQGRRVPMFRFTSRERFRDDGKLLVLGEPREMAQVLVASRPVQGDQLLTLRNLRDGTLRRFHLTAAPGEPIELRLSNLTAEDLLGVPTRHPVGRMHGGQMAIEHFVLLYGLAQAGAEGKVQPPFWYPVVETGLVAKAAERVPDRNGWPWCTTPGVFSEISKKK